MQSSKAYPTKTLSVTGTDDLSSPEWRSLAQMLQGQQGQDILSDLLDVTNTLRNTKTDSWQKRMKSLVKIRAVFRDIFVHIETDPAILELAQANFPNILTQQSAVKGTDQEKGQSKAIMYAMVAWIQRIIQPFVIFQLGDSRTSIVRETCALITWMSSEFPEEFSTVSSPTTPILGGGNGVKYFQAEALPKLITSGNKLLVDLGHQTIRLILEKSHAIETLEHHLIPYINYQNALMRLKAAQYFEILLQKELSSQSFSMHNFRECADKNWPESNQNKNSMEKNYEIFEYFLVKTLNDGDQDVRNQSRYCFLLYRELQECRSAALLLYGTSSISVLKNILKELDLDLNQIKDDYQCKYQEHTDEFGAGLEEQILQLKKIYQQASSPQDFISVQKRTKSTIEASQPQENMVNQSSSKIESGFLRDIKPPSILSPKGLKKPTILQQNFLMSSGRKSKERQFGKSQSKNRENKSLTRQNATTDNESHQRLRREDKSLENLRIVDQQSSSSQKNHKDKSTKFQYAQLKSEATNSARLHTLKKQYNFHPKEKVKNERVPTTKPAVLAPSIINQHKFTQQSTDKKGAANVPQAAATDLNKKLFDKSKMMMQPCDPQQVKSSRSVGKSSFLEQVPEETRFTKLFDQYKKSVSPSKKSRALIGGLENRASKNMLNTMQSESQFDTSQLQMNKTIEMSKTIEMNKTIELNEINEVKESLQSQTASERMQTEQQLDPCNQSISSNRREHVSITRRSKHARMRTNQLKVQNQYKTLETHEDIPEKNETNQSQMPKSSFLNIEIDDAEPILENNNLRSCTNQMVVCTEPVTDIEIMDSQQYLRQLMGLSIHQTPQEASSNQKKFQFKDSTIETSSAIQVYIPSKSKGHQPVHNAHNLPQHLRKKSSPAIRGQIAADQKRGKQLFAPSRQELQNSSRQIAQFSDEMLLASQRMSRQNVESYRTQETMTKSKQLSKTNQQVKHNFQISASKAKNNERQVQPESIDQMMQKRNVFKKCSPNIDKITHPKNLTATSTTPTEKHSKSQGSKKLPRQSKPITPGNSMSQHKRFFHMDSRRNFVDGPAVQTQPQQVSSKSPTTISTNNNGASGSNSIWEQMRHIQQTKKSSSKSTNKNSLNKTQKQVPMSITQSFVEQEFNRLIEKPLKSSNQGIQQLQRKSSNSKLNRTASLNVTRDLERSQSQAGKELSKTQNALKFNNSSSKSLNLSRNIVNKAQQPKVHSFKSMSSKQEEIQQRARVKYNRMVSIDQAKQRNASRQFTEEYIIQETQEAIQETQEAIQETQEAIQETQEAINFEEIMPPQPIRKLPKPIKSPTLQEMNAQMNMEIIEECPYPMVTSPKKMDTNPKIIDFNSDASASHKVPPKRNSNFSSQKKSMMNPQDFQEQYLVVSNTESAPNSCYIRKTNNMTAKQTNEEHEFKVIEQYVSHTVQQSPRSVLKHAFNVDQDVQLETERQKPRETYQKDILKHYRTENNNCSRSKVLKECPSNEQTQMSIAMEKVILKQQHEESVQFEKQLSIRSRDDKFHQPFIKIDQLIKEKDPKIYIRQSSSIQHEPEDCAEQEQYYKLNRPPSLNQTINDFRMSSYSRLSETKNKREKPSSSLNLSKVR